MVVIVMVMMMTMNDHYIARQGRTMDALDFITLLSIPRLLHNNCVHTVHTKW